MKMHDDEVDIDEGLVQRLVAEQFPAWASLRVIRFPTTGTDHVLFRLGDDMVVRMPRKNGVDAQVEKERRWLPQLAPLLPHAIPTPLAKGMPGAAYPFFWSVYSWLDGENPSVDAIGDRHGLARDLARFVSALHRIDATEGPPAGDQNFLRGAPLAKRDDATRRAIDELRGEIDTEAAIAAWEHSLHTSSWASSPVWVHGDITPENVLVRDGRLVAVIDFGCLGVGDPACDLMVAWDLLDADSRPTFRQELDVDDATWARGRGWALSTGLIALPYYRDTHPLRAENARYRIGQVLADVEASLTSLSTARQYGRC